MSELEIIKEIVSVVGSGGTVAVLLIMWKLGIFRNNGDTNKETNDKLDLIKDNHLHEVSESLNRIERSLERNGEKLEKIVELSTHIKARLNGKN